MRKMYKKTVTLKDLVDIWTMGDYLKRHATLEEVELPCDTEKEDHQIGEDIPYTKRQAYKFLGSYFEVKDDALIAYSRRNPFFGYEFALAMLETMTTFKPASPQLRAHYSK